MSKRRREDKHADGGHAGRQRAGRGVSQRQLRVGELIRRTLSDVLLRGNVHDPELGRMSITVGEVRATPDLRHATVFIMPLGGGDVDKALEGLRRNKGELRRAVSRAVALKYAPDLHFQPDETFDRMDETRRLFQDVRIQSDLAEDQNPSENAPDQDAGDADAGGR